MKAGLSVALLVLTAVVVGLALRPICVPLPAEALAQFNVPIDQRTDRDFYVKVFQLRDGRWHQCKTWISRQLFF